MARARSPPALPESAPVARGPPRPMARFRLELGPIPLHHQVYLDLKAALDERRVAPRRPAAHRARARASATAAASSPSGARSTSWSASSGSSGPAAAARSSSIRASTATSPATCRFTEEMQTRGLDPGDAADRGAARVRGRGRRGRRSGSSPARRRSTSSGCASPTASRCSSSRSTCPPSGSRAARLGPRARLALRPADRALRRARRPRPRGPRAGPAARSRGRLLERKPGTPALLIEGIASTDDGTPVEFGRTFVRGDRTRYYVERVVVRPRWTHAPGPRDGGGGTDPCDRTAPARPVTNATTAEERDGATARAPRRPPRRRRC